LGLNNEKFSERELGGLKVILNVEDTHDKILAHVIISKEPDTEPISDDVLAVIIEDTHGHFLEPIDWPEPGILPETQTRWSTASAEFSFKPLHTNLKCAIVVFRGDWAEFPL